MRAVESTRLQESSHQSQGVTTPRSNPATVQYTKGKHTHSKEDEVQKTHTHKINKGGHTSLGHTISCGCFSSSARNHNGRRHRRQIHPKFSRRCKYVQENHDCNQIENQNWDTHYQSHCGETVGSPGKWKHIHTLDLFSSSFLSLDTTAKKKQQT